MIVDSDRGALASCFRSRSAMWRFLDRVREVTKCALGMPSTSRTRAHLEAKLSFLARDAFDCGDATKRFVASVKPDHVDPRNGTVSWFLSQPGVVEIRAVVDE